MSTSAICGVRFSDQLAALLDHAASCEGWRVEPDSRPKGTGVVVYPADKTHSPITVEERKAQFNKAHYENLRRQLDRAGLPPMPAEVMAAARRAEAEEATSPAIFAVRSAEEAVAQSGPGAEAVSLGNGAGFANTPELQRILDDEDKAPDFVGEVAAGLARQAHLGVAEAELLKGLVEMTMSWALAMSPDRLGELIEARAETVRAEMEGQVNEALQMAADAERARAAADAQRARSEERERKAREDCGAALRRAESAEAKAAELERAIAPLRAILATPEAS